MKDKIKKSTKKRNKKDINYVSLIISIFIIILTMSVNEATAIRPIMWIIAIILLTINIIRAFKLKPFYIIFIFLIAILLSLVIDGLSSLAFKHIPVFSYNITNLGNTKVYNSLGLRVWQCDKNKKEFIFDLFNKNGYMCNAEEIDAIDSNSFLNSIVSNYSEYKNKYIKIKGKISKKTGQNYLEMQPYETNNIKINGEVSFADNITLKILFDNNTEELNNYDVYDEIIIVGLIKNLETNNSKYTVYMSEAKIVSNINLNDFNVGITSENTCTEKRLVYSNTEHDIYTYCIQDIFINYPDNNYELANALSSNKLQIEELYNNPLEVLHNDEDNSNIYKFSDYNIMICDDTTSRDVIIGNKQMNFDSVTCNKIVE